MNPNGWAPIGPSCMYNGQTGYGRNESTAPVSGRAAAIALDPVDPDHVIYLGTASGGVWKSDDGGLNWTPKSDFEASLAIGALAINPNDRLNIWAGTGEGNDASADAYFGYGLLVSSNGGDTWQLKNDPLLTGTRINGLALEPLGAGPAQLHVVVGCTKGLIESSNGGGTWTQTPVMGSTARVTSLVLLADPDPTKTVLYVAVFAKGVYKRTGNGAFTAVGWVPPANVQRISISVCKSHPDNLAIVCADNTDAISAFVFRPDPAPGAWAPLHFTENLKQGGYNQVVAMHPTDPKIILVGDTRLWRTKDSGDSWDIVSNPHSGSPGIHADQHAVVFHPINADKIWAANDGGVWYSENGGDTWSHRNRGLQTMQFHSLAQHPLYESLILCGAQDNGTQRFMGNPSWEKVRPGDGFIVGIDPSQPNIWYATYIYRKAAPPGAHEANAFDTTNLMGFYRSDQSGKPDSFSVKVQGLRNDDTPVSIFWQPFAIDPTPQGPGKPHLLYMTTNKIYWSDDAGDHWNPLLNQSDGNPFSTGTTNAELITAVAVAPSNPSVMYVTTTDGRVFRLEKQAGGKWASQDISVSLPSPAYLSAIAVDPSDANGVYVAIGSAHGTSGNAPAVADGRIYWKNTSAVGPWVRLGKAQLNLTITGVTIDHTTNPVNAIALDPDHPKHVYIGCDVGVFKSTDGGMNWTAFNENLPNVAVIDLQIHKASRLLRAATSGRSAWERPLDIAPSAVSGVNLYIRDSVIDLGRRETADNVDDPLDPEVKDTWSSGADIQVDTPTFGLGLFGGYQTPASTVNYQENGPIDYLGFQQLTFKHPRKGATSKLHVEVVNRGPVSAQDVTVRTFFAARNADKTYPDLPADFWTQFPSDSSDISVWKPVGSSMNIPGIPPGEARVASWDWDVPMGASDPLGILAVVDSAQDPAGEIRLQVKPLASENPHVALREVEVSFPVAEVVVGVLLVVGVAALAGYGISKAVA